MAQVNMNVDTQKAKECAKNIISLSNEYINTIDSLFSKLQKVKETGAWVGKSADTFIQNVKNDKKNYTRVGKELKKYGTSLRKTAESIEFCMAQNAI